MRPLALITGANRGIGFETARQLAAKGFEVLLGARDAEAGEAAAAELDAAWLPLDVADPGSVREAADWVRAEHGRLEVLVNNAGVLLGEDRGVLDFQEAEILATLQVNLLGAWRVAAAFAPLMAQGGRIVNISSGAGQLSSMGTYAPAYAVSKAALNALTVQLAKSLAPKGIAVNAVCPGWVKTRMGGSGAPKSLEDGADTPVWLAAEAPAALTGKFFRDRREIPW
ncbi:MAG TPA: SDR family NAD(P)-dependent oxidoreductase [Holophagaceae bacterium]|nr:SDR family NAD(P)-dependent oxidoreductase [Holophagaceae bacterium]